MNAPERAQPGYKEAADFVRNLCLDKNIRIEFDVTPTDRWKRILGYVFVEDDDGKEIFVNAELLRAGHAKFFGFFSTDRYDELLKAVYCTDN